MGSALYPAEPSGDAWLCDLAGRLAFAHRPGPDLFAFTVGLSDNGAVLLLAGGSVELTSDQRERLELTVNILLRLEWRLQADRTEILAWQETPNVSLDGAKPLARMAAGVDALREVRRAIDTAAVPEVRWWRVGHNRG